jgi:predicted 3-demethylubiquinone-9 3-methyltransferase (glyoxalase superfamily)
MQKITTFLMFEGKAEEAMNFYISLFKQSKIVSISRYGANDLSVKIGDKYGVSWQLTLV